MTKKCRTGLGLVVGVGNGWLDRILIGDSVQGSGDTAGGSGMHIRRSERLGQGSGVVGDCSDESRLSLDTTMVCLGPLGCHGYDMYQTCLVHDSAWLSNLSAGQVTPRALQHALNTTIFLQLGITPKQPISKRTAHWWLIKLGWQKTVVQKGVYMDGHERWDDVVKYHKDIFLPVMQDYER